MWKFVKLNYYGGRVYRHTDGRLAIEIFNHHFQSLGYNVRFPDGSWTTVKAL